MTDLIANTLFNKISILLENSQKRVLSLVNQTIVLT
jgi:mannose/fructose-specific phosphotransferase system component IIA